MRAREALWLMTSLPIPVGIVVFLASPSPVVKVLVALPAPTSRPERAAPTGYRLGSWLRASQAAKEQPPAQPSLPLATVNQALALAAADLSTISAQHRHYFRYVWVTDGDYESAQCISLILNYLSRESERVIAPILGKDRLVLVRVDFRDYAPFFKDMKEFADAWEEFRFDPLLNILITKDTLKFATGIEIPKQKRLVAKMKKVTGKDGKSYDEEYQETVEVDPLETDDVVRIQGDWLDPALTHFLGEETGSEAPLVSHRYFAVRSLSTVQDGEVAADSKVFKTLYGGLYYRLAGVPLAGKKGTDLDALLELLGVGDTALGLTADKIFDERTRSDKRVAMEKSGVTEKPRRVDILPTLATGLTEGFSCIFVTQDLTSEDIDIGTHPLLNLDRIRVKAREVIWTRANGLHGFGLYNGVGKRQDRVPQNVVEMDTTAPLGWRRELQAAISCIRCHAQDDGLRKLRNDVIALSKVVDIFGSLLARDQVEEVARVKGRYKGNLELAALPLARNFYVQAILLSGGEWKGSKAAQTDVAKLSGDKIGAIFAQYAAPVDAAAILRDLGVEVGDPKQAKDVLAKLIPVGTPEDGRYALILSGLPVLRVDYDQMFGFKASRYARSKN